MATHDGLFNRSRGFARGSISRCENHAQPPFHMAARGSDMRIPFSVTQRGAGYIDPGYP